MDESQNTNMPPVQNTAPAPAVTPTSNPLPTTGSSNASLGPIVAAIVILAALIFGVLYFMEAGKIAAPVEETQGEVTQGSDAAADIEADLNATDIEGIDASLEE